MPQQVIRTPLVNEDILVIWDYIARDNVVAADKLLCRSDETFFQIARTPGMGSLQEKYGVGIRAFPVGNYIIFYQDIDAGIEVLRVLHGARNLDDLL